METEMARFSTANNGHICWPLVALQSILACSLRDSCPGNDYPRAVRNNVNFVEVSGIPDLSIYENVVPKFSNLIAYFRLSNPRGFRK